MEHPFLLLLTTLLALSRPTIVHGQNSTTGPDYDCTGKVDGSYCMDCLELVYCSDGTALGPASCTPQETACQEVSAGVAGCLAEAQATDCSCTGDICDPYDPDSSVSCNEDGIYDVVDCTGCSNLVCLGPGESTPPPGAGNCSDASAIKGGWNPVTPDCTSAFYCDSAGTQTATQECSAGQYVDQHGNCVTGQPQPCAGCSSDICPDYTDCTQFYSCSDGAPVGDALLCPDSGHFNASATAPPFCSSSADVCAPLTKCEWGSTGSGSTTPVGGTTPAGGTNTTGGTTPVGGVTPSEECSEDNVGNYPSGDCSSSYWSCRNTGGGNYQYIQMECPSGTVFSTDPDYPYCEKPENVSTCSSQLPERH